jgi:FKBP-type peptidyl-prolyl cis-trans isomerase
MVVGAPHFKGDFLDLISQLHAGDSASFFVKLGLLKESFPGQFDFPEPAIDKMEYLGFAIKVDSIWTKKQTEAEQARIEAEARITGEVQAKVDSLMRPYRETAAAKEQQLVAENEKLLDEYLKENKITGRPDADGIYFTELVAGTGSLIENGMTVSVRYTGTYLDGTIFDSNWLFDGQRPLTFVVGPQMIPGFTAAILKMRAGGKARFIVPPAMGYKDGLSRVFEVEIISAKK